MSLHLLQLKSSMDEITQMWVLQLNTHAVNILSHFLQQKVVVLFWKLNFYVQDEAENIFFKLISNWYNKLIIWVFLFSGFLYFQTIC